MSKNNPRCDVHMYKNKPNAKFLFLWLQLLKGVVCFHPLGQATYTFYIIKRISIDM
jgi:hypothetical protein